MSSKIFLLTLTLLCGCIVYTYGCSCMPKHPQQHYCDSDFVILARVKQSRTIGNQLIYKVRVRKEYKMSEKSLTALKAGRLLTSSFSSLCGVELQNGKLYVISGRVHSLKAFINMCGMIEKWEHLSRRQRKGLKLMYRQGCTCNIRKCSLGSRCSRTANECIWSNINCQEKEGICLRQKNKTCNWNKNRALQTCMKNSTTILPYRNFGGT